MDETPLSRLSRERDALAIVSKAIRDKSCFTEDEKLSVSYNLEKIDEDIASQRDSLARDASEEDKQRQDAQKVLREREDLLNAVFEQPELRGFQRYMTLFRERHAELSASARR